MKLKMEDVITWFFAVAVAWLAFMMGVVIFVLLTKGVSCL